jgi:hypothetical protein
MYVTYNNKAINKFLIQTTLTGTMLQKELVLAGYALKFILI